VGEHKEQMTMDIKRELRWLKNLTNVDTATASTIIKTATGALARIEELEVALGPVRSGEVPLGPVPPQSGPYQFVVTAYGNWDRMTPLYDTPICVAGVGSSLEAAIEALRFAQRRLEDTCHAGHVTAWGLKWFPRRETV
jgi:hypothetical protein